LVNESDLESDLRNSAHLKRAKELVHNLGKTHIDIIADYLRLLWKHATDDIIRDRGSIAFKGSPLKVWITVPAIWEEDAREGMRQAVKKAGILEDRTAGKTTVDLVAEPEAAAMAVLDDFKGRPDVKVG
jgi:molecular chaperone DnaK (HSP70)